MPSTPRPPPDEAPNEAYVWIWLPEATEPIVAGRIVRDRDGFVFNYGRSYLARADRIPIYEPELPLRPGVIAPAPDLTIAGCLRDAAPDAWGRRVILDRLTGARGRDADPGTLDELTYLLFSGSDRIGALDFQRSATRYVPRDPQPAPLDALARAAERIERGLPLTPELERALLHGTSLGGARPKAGIADGDRRLIAKFSSSSDTYDVVKAEFVAMRLAAHVGLDVAPVRLARAAGRDVLLVERFDRVPTADGLARRAMVSALTLLGLHEMTARYAAWEDLCEIVRSRFVNPRETLPELFARLVFNVLVGNTDDHARNHAAFWDGTRLALTPAYDVCPQARSGGEATQAMAIAGADRRSRLATCLAAAPAFHLAPDAAERLIADQVRALKAAWPAVAAEAGLSPAARALMETRMLLPAYAFEEAPEGLVRLRGR
ncbi:type II toxin-antitoxin system HipA family toxin [Salinarimonas chemoclinalis]|uniref:type II toxin-antitoxin system HipA family toxin n=1 Tax=Salinarimonas chemoclinalis TaxID=3241599 RepID=UPI003558A02B